MLLQNTKLVVSALAVMMLAGFAVPAFSAADGGSSTVPTCTNGKVWDKNKKKCVVVQGKGQLDDQNIYETARDLAYNRRYEEAITILKFAENQRDPRILNYLGYSNRKLGRIEAGIEYYSAALKEDPDYTLVMEYMGEAFLQLGQVDKAREQLSEIERRCGRDCREYALLKAEIDQYVSR